MGHRTGTTPHQDYLHYDSYLGPDVLLESLSLLRALVWCSECVTPVLSWAVVTVSA